MGAESCEQGFETVSGKKCPQFLCPPYSGGGDLVLRYLGLWVERLGSESALLCVNPKMPSAPAELVLLVGDGVNPNWATVFPLGTVLVNVEALDGPAGRMS